MNNAICANKKTKKHLKIKKKKNKTLELKIGQIVKMTQVNAYEFQEHFKADCQVVLANPVSRPC